MKSKIVVEAMSLMAASPIHRVWTVADIGRLILPPIALDQYVMLRDEADRPVAFGTWAFLTREAQKGFQWETRKLQASDWNAGRIPWGIDVICIDGNPRRLIEAMRARLRAEGHAGKVIKFRRQKPSGIRHSRGRI